MRKHVSALMSAIEETKMKQHIDLRTQELHEGILKLSNALRNQAVRDGGQRMSAATLGAEANVGADLPPIRDQKEESRRRVSRRQQLRNGGEKPGRDTGAEIAGAEGQAGAGGRIVSSIGVGGAVMAMDPGEGGWGARGAAGGRSL